MEFTSSKADLLASVLVVSRAVPASTVEPMLLNVLLDLDNGQLTLRTTDGRISLRHRQPVEEKVPGRLAVLGHLLLEILQGIQSSRSDQVTFASTPENRVVLSSADAVYNIAGFPAENFPMLPEIEALTRTALPGGLLKEMVRKTTVVSSGGGGGPHTYEEVLMESRSGELSFVATDSVRLAILTNKLEKALPDFHSLVPSHALVELGRLLKPDQEVEITLAEDQAAFVFGATEMRTRLSDKTFPNFRAILPKVQSRNLVLRTREFQDNLRGVIPLAKDTKHKVFLDFQRERVIITSTSPEHGEARREVEASLTGEPIRLAFNGKYLLDFLSVVDTESFKWGVSSASYPATLTPDSEGSGYTYVLMPITQKET
ncbi:MAG: DNA polymerase III subunit beta [Candidatus Riflebacteria bacterium]|nr:DNA polymerase III subunit beta [Candidatus Riflebacteria bacterium]